MRLVKEMKPSSEEVGGRILSLGKRVFALMDEALAEELKAQSPRWLSDPRIAQVARDSVYYWHERRFYLHRYVIMPNHVHILIEPLKVRQAVSLPKQQYANNPHYYKLSTILQGIKGYSARQANKILSRKGPFWQDESFDHWVRDEVEYRRIIDYIDMNPVKAGLCSSPSDWKWSSANEAT